MSEKAHQKAQQNLYKSPSQSPLKKKHQGLVRQVVIGENELNDNDTIVSVLENSIQISNIEQDVYQKHGTVAKSIGNPASLRNRQDQLHESEKKLLFASSNEKACDTWVCVINYLRLIQKQQELKTVENVRMFD